MKGFVRIIRDRRIVDAGPNLVVTTGRALLAERAVDVVMGDVVAQIGFGTSDAVVSPDDTGLSVDAFVKALDGFSYPEPGKVTFSWSLDYGEANGLTIREIGLISAGGVLIARRLPAPEIVKTIDVSLSGTWTLTF